MEIVDFDLKLTARNSEWVYLLRLRRPLTEAGYIVSQFLFWLQ